jgi:hypothetical protein
VWQAATAESVRHWVGQERRVADLLADYVYHGPQARGFVQDWLVLAPLPLNPGEKGAQGLDREQLPNESQLRPRAGDVVPIAAHPAIWRKVHSPDAVLDLNGVLGQVTEWSAAYAVCLLESDRARHDLFIQVTSDDQAKVYLNGQRVYEFRSPRSLVRVAAWPQGGLDTAPVALCHGVNVLVFKVVNETGNWEACIRLVDEDGLPAQGIDVRLTP